MTDFGEIKHLELRKIWPNEAYNFTKDSENAPPGRAGMNPSVREAGWSS